MKFGDLVYVLVGEEVVVPIVNEELKDILLFKINFQSNTIRELKDKIVCEGRYVKIKGLEKGNYLLKGKSLRIKIFV